MSRSTDAGETDRRRLPSRERRPRCGRPFRYSPTIASRPRQNRFATRIGLERCKTSTVLSPPLGPHWTANGEGEMHSRPQEFGLICAALRGHSLSTWSQIMMKTPFAIAAAAAVGLSFAQPALGQSDDTKLGTVHFETSCKPEAQK